ncbi:uncharacterized protein EI90DRAFT_2367576 [Cantharellus anzutake]|uniref:uncharacterized protein n=1 Tax=Cantharellus anzutake TaxID=1750568 RepID=UPI0019089AAA|nr:uncharacterized protein EI90DRAFT_2367576 [Cantharellus anzutake]KAF8324206.1 hypothetical protein EI90DRAFT_2367576 [Cantharellus anzutake]
MGRFGITHPDQHHGISWVHSETMTFTQLLEENIHVECVTCTLAGSATILEAAKAVHHGHNCFRRFLYGGEEPRFRVLEDSEDMILEHIASAHPNARPDLQYCFKGPNHQTPRKPIPRHILTSNNRVVGTVQVGVASTPICAMILAIGDG